MANYRRQGSNLAQFMREQLNTVPTTEPEEDFSNIDNLDLFANTQFFDFDTQTQTDFKPTADSPASSKPEPTSATSTIPGEFGSMDFNMNNGRPFWIFYLRLMLALAGLGLRDCFSLARSACAPLPSLCGRKFSRGLPTSNHGHHDQMFSLLLRVRQKVPRLGGAEFSAGDGECRETCRRGKCLLCLRPVPKGSDLPPETWTKSQWHSAIAHREE